ncbi:MAG: hypothetical protein V3R84_10365 [Acidimicrobiia bacterium]
MSVQRDDLEAKLREIQSAFDETKGNARNVTLAAALVVAVVVILAFLMGRRKGGKGKSRIEVYEVRG